MKKLPTSLTILKTLFFVLSFSFSTVYGQETIPASGGDATGSGGSASYTVGQIVYTTETGVNGSVAQGVQQPYEVTIVGKDERPELNLEFSVFPNPTYDKLTLKTNEYPYEKLSYKIFDINGNQLYETNLVSATSTIDVQQYPVGVYFIKIIESKVEVKTFKVIKN